MRKEFCVLTHSGRVINLLKPDPADIVIYDIAEALSKLCRYNGHVQNFYSVAQHSCLVVDHLSISAKPYGLLADAYQAYFGHLIRPVKKTLISKAEMDIWQKLADPMKAAIHEAFGLKYPPHTTHLRLIAEKKAVIEACEKRDLIARHSLAPDEQEKAVGRLIRPWPWAEAHEMYLGKFHEIAKTHPQFSQKL